MDSEFAISDLGGASKYSLCSPLLREDSQFD